MLTRLYNLTMWVIALACIALALLVSVARLFLPLVADQRAMVEARIGELLGQPIEIASVEAEIRGIFPRIYLQDVRLLDPLGESVVLRADQFVIDIDPVQSLLTLSPSLQKVSVRGVDLEVERTEDNRIVVRGVWERSLDEPPPEVGRAQWSGLEGLSFSLGDSRVHWVDRPTSRDLVFEHIQLTVRLDRERLRVAGSLEPPEELGHSLEVVADLRGDLAAAGGWSGVIFARGESLRFPLIPASGLLADQGLEDGEGSIEVWSHWRQAKLVRLAGEATLDDLMFRLSPSGGEELTHRLDGVAGQLVWETLPGGGWRAQVASLEVGREGRNWPAGGFHAELRPSGETRLLRVSADILRLDDIVPLALIGDGLDPGVAERVQALSLQGDLRDLRLDVEWTGERVHWLRADGQFRDIGFAPLAELRSPGVQGLDGGFSMARDWGEITLATGGVTLDYPTVFSDTIRLQQLLATARWQHDTDGWRLQTDRMQLSSADLDASGTLLLQERAGATAPHIDLQLDFVDGNVASTSRYLPRMLHENVRSWLDTALVAGRLEQGHLALTGPLDRFPFRDGSGLFETRFDVSDVTLKYRPDWPVLRGMAGQVVFNGPSLAIDVRAGRIYDTQLAEGHVEIADFRRPLLEIEAQARGPAANGLRYMANSDIGRGQTEALGLVDIRGPASLDLDLEIPLARKLNRELALDGRVTLEGVTVAIPSAQVTITDLEGALRFTRDTLEAKDIKGRYLDAELTVNANRPSGGDIRIEGEGVFPAAPMVSPYVPALAARLEGESSWFAHVSLPMGSGGHTQLDLISDLEGVQVDLPSPVGKAETEARTLTLRGDFGAQALPVFRVAYGDVISSAFEIAREGEGEAGVRRAELRFFEGNAQLPDQGVRLAGRIPYLDLEEWQQALETARSASAPASGGMAYAIPDWLAALELEIQHLEALGRAMENVRISAKREPEAWRALISSPPMSGLMILPYSTQADQPLELELEHLNVDLLQREDDGEDEGEGGGVDPRDLPSLRVSSDRLIHQGQNYRDLRLETSRQNTGQQVHVFQITHEHGSVRVYGEWRARSAGRQRSSFRFEGESDNVGILLNQLEFDTGIHRGKGKIDGDLAWRGAPYDFELERLSGKVHLLIEDGRLIQVDPGAGRFVGLLNLSSLPRRLSLDFSDVFQQGFVFDRIEGNLRFADQAMYTNDLHVEGPAAKVTFAGRTDIAERSYDQTIVVRPEVGGALPVAGALMGGATVGAAVFVLQKLLPGGGEATPATEIRYRMTGSWDAPKLEKVSGPETPDEEPYNPWQQAN